MLHVAEVERSPAFYERLWLEMIDTMGEPIGFRRRHVFLQG